MPARPRRPDEEVIPLSQGARPLRPGEMGVGIPPSRTGVVPEETRQEISDIVEKESVLGRFFLQATPAATGSFIFGAVGSVIPGVGTIAGAVFGGVLGEFIGQELGLTPQSDVGLAIAGGGPVAGRLLAVPARAAARGVGKGITSIAPAKAAIARKVIKEAVDEMSSFGARVLSKQKGIMRVPASKIYTTVRGLGVQIDPRHSFTLKTLDSLEKELIKISPGFPEVAQALRTIRAVKGTLSGESISFSEIISTKQLIGAAVKKTERATGIKLRTPKAVSKAMFDDIDALAARGKGLKGTAAKLLKKANARAKLEFSVGEFEEGLAQNLTFISPEGSITLNVSGFRNWLRRITDPNHKQYNKNFTESLKDELPEVQRRLAELDKITQTLSPGGPGSLIIRGAGASTFSKLLGAGAGGAAGFSLGGEIGGAAGALIGAQMPEIITALLLSKTGSALLVRATMMGRGTVNEQAWAQLGQFLGQAIKPALTQQQDTRTRASFIRPSQAQVPIQ